MNSDAMVSYMQTVKKKKNKKNNQQKRAGNTKFIDKETGSLAARGGGEWWRK